jgi:hypothetical protein
MENPVTNLIPEPMTMDRLADILDDMAARVRAGDSFEGHIEYMLPDEESAGDLLPKPDVDVYVSGVYRIGNLHYGQGGVRMIGTVRGE